MTSKHVVLPGGSGFLGANLTKLLVARGDRVTVLTRGNTRSIPGVEFVHWDGRTPGSWSSVVDGADAIVHLSGKRVDCLPTQSNIAELISSRVEPVSAVGEAWRAAAAPPPVWVQLSSLAIYGEGGEATIDESTRPSGEGPAQMVRVCHEWEAAYRASSESVPRSVLLRPGIGIGGSGDPATDRLMFLARAGLGGKVGSGTQWVSWIALVDFMRVLLRAIDLDDMTGLYHVTSPHPVRNSEMMSVYRTAAGRKFGLSSPAWLTRVGAFLLFSDPALALTGRRCEPTRLLREGFRFEIPWLEDAVAATAVSPAN